MARGPCETGDPPASAAAHRAEQSPHPAWEWRRDGVYCAMTLISGGIARGGILSLGSVVAPVHARLPLEEQPREEA